MLEALIPPGLPPRRCGTLAAGLRGHLHDNGGLRCRGRVMLLGLMALWLPPVAIVPVHGLIQLGSNGGRLAMTWRKADWGSGGICAGCGSGDGRRRPGAGSAPGNRLAADHRRFHPVAVLGPAHPESSTRQTRHICGFDPDQLHNPLRGGHRPAGGRPLSSSFIPTVFAPSPLSPGP